MIVRVIYTDLDLVGVIAFHCCTHLWSHLGRLQPFREASESHDHDHDDTGGSKCDHHRDDNFNSFGGSSCALEGCMGLLVSDAEVFSVSAGTVAVRKAVLARAAGEMNADYVEVSTWFTTGDSWWGQAAAGSCEGGVTWSTCKSFGQLRCSWEQGAIAFWTHSLGDE